ncbi:MAG TPA: phosphatidylinositol mannoside acyltransferase [Streptosporangiaceae bacterium]|nr:phosphatidylinositol mannoside acyltransferase [Streptosporangiaceae bacterium]
MSGLRDRLIDAGYGLGWSVVCRLPESWAQSAFRFFADLAWLRRGPGVRVLEANLRRVIGCQAPVDQLRGLSRQAMRSYARYWLEAFRLPVTPTARLVAGMHDTGHIRDAFGYLAAGRGVILALPHMGNYDLAGAWLIAKGAGSVTVVAERVQPESVYDRFVAFREGIGMEVVPASGGTGSVFGILAQRLRAGKTVGLVCDRDVTGAGIEVEFFGEKARMMGGPAALAVQTGAALMPVILWFEGDHWGAHVHAEVLVPAEGDNEQQAAAMMREVARLFEAGIGAHPQDWHMLQRVFVADLDPGRLRRAAAGESSQR